MEDPGSPDKVPNDGSDEEASQSNTGQSDQRAAGNFNLAEFMLNKKNLEKARVDIKRVKNIMIEMQGYVQDHQI